MLGVPRAKHAAIALKHSLVAGRRHSATGRSDSGRAVGGLFSVRSESQWEAEGLGDDFGEEAVFSQAISRRNELGGFVAGDVVNGREAVMQRAGHPFQDGSCEVFWGEVAGRQTGQRTAHGRIESRAREVRFAA